MTESKTVKDILRQAASTLGRQGGLKGGPISAQKLTKKQREERARKAVMARWNKNKKNKS